MNVTLGEALNLLDTKKQKIRDLVSLRNSSAMISFEEGDDESFIDRPERTVEDITSELEFLRKQVRKLQLVITKSNVELVTDVEYDGSKLALGEVLVLIKELREDLPHLQRLSEKKNRKTKQNERQVIEGQITTVKVVKVQETTFEVEPFKVKVKETEKLIQQLQATITKFNVDTQVDFVDEEYSA